MDQDRPLASSGYLQLEDEAFPLHRVRSAFVIVVEADFAAGNHLRLGQQAIKLGQDRVVDFSRIVGINARARVETRKLRALRRLRIEFAAEVKRAIHAGSVLANADGQHRAHTCVEGAGEHGGAVFGVAFAVQVGVGIDQQRVLDFTKRQFAATAGG
jgi:hypothetical protein